MSARGLELINSKPGFAPDEELWVGKKQLGVGGQGCAGLFVKLDPETRKVVRQMVVKETWPVTDWNNEYDFFGPNKDVPREEFMSRILPKESNVIDIICSRLFKERNALRLYMEYCPGGDLRRLLHEYQERSHVFPEPFLWKVFHDLARAIQAMDNPSGHGLKGDESVAHVDFKPGNIFLRLPDANNFPKYPIAVLGDFGGAMISSPRDTEEEHSKKVESTAQSEGYVAPDIERFFRNKPTYHMPKRNAKAGITLAHVPKRITSATNVWNAGLIIADLMTAAQCFKKPKFAVYDARDAWLDDFFSQRNTNPGMQSYSALLKDTVIRCLDYMPRQRPTPTELLAIVNRGVNMYTGVMRTRDCFDTTQYHGQHDLDPNIPFVDDYPVTQEEVMDLSMSDSIPSTNYPPGGLPTPKTPFKKPPRNPHDTQPSITTASGAPYDTPAQGFLVGPNAGQSVQNFFDPAAGYEVLNQPAPQFDFVDQDGLLQALEDSIPHG